MDIIRKNIGIDFKTEAVHFYLAQIPSRPNNINHTLNSEYTSSTIKSILSFVVTSFRQNPFHFLVFPEISIPYAHLYDTISFIQDHFPINTVTILGIELITVADCMELVEKLDIRDKR
ncbi:MAG TPA: hypothetical protein PK745_17985, partial [bacterium]|nr:hypothetical protein [bacterium]